MIEVVEEADADDQEEEPPEELYTTLTTSTVGVQYYEGRIRRELHCMPQVNPSARSRWVWRTGEARTGAIQPVRPVSGFHGACMR